MELKQDFIEKITNCNWFENCGDQNFDRFEVVYMNNKQEAVERISSMKWERVCLEKTGDATVFLFKHHNEQYQKWNDGVQEIKTVYLGEIEKRIAIGLKEKGLFLDAVLNDVRSNIITLCMLDYYSEYYTMDVFHQHMLELYMCGYLPCGWSGGLKDGKFKVY